MELTLIQRAEKAERASQADEFRIISEAALAVFGWQDERYKHVLRLLEVGASLDAAMTLVPEGCWGAFGPHFMDEERSVKFRGYIFWPDWTRWTPHGDWIGRSEGTPLCATPALALVSAALRARSAQP